MFKSRTVDRMAFSEEGLTAGVKLQNHCCPVKRGLFCKLGLLHKGFWGVYFGGTLSAVWASGGNFLPDFSSVPTQ
jgi:hypothetical protein